MDTVALPRTSDTVVQLVWAPSELYALDKQCDVLQAVLPPVRVARERPAQLRASVLTASFGTLHHAWAPALQSSLSSSPTSVTTASRAGDERDEAAAAVTTCTRMTSTITATTTTTTTSATSAVAAQRKGGAVWYRFCTRHAHTTFVVDRTPAHVTTLLAALSYSFPHLLVPDAATLAATADDSDDNDGSDDAVTAALCSFVMRHAARVAAYLPVLFFFYERHEPTALLFLRSLDTLLQQNKRYEATVNASLRPPPAPAAVSSSRSGGGWFSWGSSSSSSKTQQPTRNNSNNSSSADEEANRAFVERAADVLPRSFASVYTAAQARCRVAARARDRAVALAEALTSATSNSAAVAATAAVTAAPLSSSPLRARSDSDDGDGSGACDAVATTREPAAAAVVATTLARLCRDVDALADGVWPSPEQLQHAVDAVHLLSTQRGDVSSAPLLLRRIAATLQRAALYCDSTWRYLNAYVDMKRTVVDDAAVVEQRLPPVKGAAAASNSTLLRQAAALHASYKAMLQRCEVVMHDELADAARMLHKELRLLCTLVGDKNDNDNNRQVATADLQPTPPPPCEQPQCEEPRRSMHDDDDDDDTSDDD